jgi:hypothetical protein
MMEETDRKLLWSLMPGWVKEQPEGLCPMFYGTCTREGDIKVKERLVSIIGEPPSQKL